MLIEQERQDGMLGLGVLCGGHGGSMLGAMRRVLVSHEESTLLVVRWPVTFMRGGSPLLGAGTSIPFPLRLAW
jgi:hypothetical protein